jgi:hypothetical protein
VTARDIGDEVLRRSVMAVMLKTSEVEASYRSTRSAEIHGVVIRPGEIVFSDSTALSLPQKEIGSGASASGGCQRICQEK